MTKLKKYDIHLHHSTLNETAISYLLFKNFCHWVILSENLSLSRRVWQQMERGLMALNIGSLKKLIKLNSKCIFFVGLLSLFSLYHPQLGPTWMAISIYPLKKLSKIQKYFSFVLDCLPLCYSPMFGQKQEDIKGYNLYFLI